MLPLEERMYQRTPRAFVWIDDKSVESAAPVATQASRSEPSTERTAWVQRPVQTKYSRIVAARLSGANVKLAVVNGHRIRWREANEVLTGSEAKRWLIESFK